MQVLQISKVSAGWAILLVNSNLPFVQRKPFFWKCSESMTICRETVNIWIHKLTALVIRRSCYPSSDIHNLNTMQNAFVYDDSCYSFYSNKNIILHIYQLSWASQTRQTVSNKALTKLVIIAVCICYCFHTYIHTYVHSYINLCMYSIHNSILYI